MPDSRLISPIGPFRATMRPPGSKSLTNRALLLAALAEGTSRLTGVLFAEDTRAMLGALEALGIGLRVDEANRCVEVTGRGTLAPPEPPPPTAPPVALNLGNAGTAMRFLAAACAAAPGLACTLDGIQRMRQRPIGELVRALRWLGAKIDYLNEEGFPPFLIDGVPLDGGELTLQPTLSSQYVSALLQVAPRTAEGITLRFEGPVTSRPYVEMTMRLMAHFGVTGEVDPAFTRIAVKPGRYRATDYAVEPDASAASYFLAAAAVVPGSSCTIEGLGRGSLQGDVAFADVLHQMGAGLVFGRDFITVQAPSGGPNGAKLRGIDIDLNAMPDVALTLAAIAPLAEGPTAIRNVGNLRVKETDRLAALQTELRKLGVGAEIEGDDLLITPPATGKLTPPPAGIDTYNDHRMAMAFAVLGLALPGGLRINDPACVHKTFPEFFEYLERLK